MKELIKLLAILFILYLVWLIQKNNIIDTGVEFFANQFYENHLPEKIMDRGSKCPNKLYKEDNQYYLVNTSRPLVPDKNPRRFETYGEYLKYAKILHEKHSCPILEITDITNKIIKKNNPEDDPAETYQRRCNKKIAKKTYDLLNEVSNQTEVLTVTSKAQNNNHIDVNYYKNYDVEECMKELYLSEHDGIMATPL